MGQKVHPLGFRVGITKKHQSQWFARFHKHKYSQSVLEDRMIRQTLTTLFPQLINPSLKKVQKRAEDRELKANITQIKIERALIPYEISIQIHAENCELIKSALDNLTVQPDLVCKLEKARRYLFSLNDKLSQMSIIKETFKADQAQSNLSKTAPVMALSSGKSNSEEKQALSSAATGKVENKSPNKTSEKNQSKSSVFSKAKQAFGVRNGAKLTKQEFRKQRILKKRFLKRQSIKNRYRQLIVKNLLLKKKANKIVQKLSLKNKKLNSKTNKFTKKSPKLKKNFLKVRNQNKLSPIPFGEKARSEQVYFSGKIKNAGQQSRNDFAAGGSAPGLRNQAQTGSRLASQKNQTKNLLASRIKKKFVSLFIKKRNKNFLLDLKTSLKYWYENKKYQRFSTINSLAERPVSKDKLLLGAPIGYSKKWSLNRLETLKKEPLTKLNRLVSILEEKALIKMESLRKEFIAFGFVSKTQSFGYYQIINFLKHLKELVNKLKRERFYSRDSIGNKIASAPFAPKEERGSKPQQILNKLSYTSLTAPGENISRLQGLNLSSLVGEKSSAPKSLAETVLRSKLGNIAVECRKIKFIEYLKQIIKKHRQENIFFYLSTVSEANKNLKKLKQFTKQNSNFLFGTKLRKNQISRVLVKSGEKSDLEKNLQDIFLEQIEKQRTMHQENKQLIPKISIQFFSVQPSLVSIKASTVADLVVDDLEKRKAFRQVIKKAKEELMKKTGVKGVKIQLSGRLNGAEIARTEWVRAGRIPLQTLRANLDYAYRTANTIYGIIGVKVWVFKGLKTI